MTALLLLLALDVVPAERRCVTGETHQLSADAPRQWSRGTVLKALAVNTGGRVPAPDAFDAASLVIRLGGEVLKEGPDYVVDKGWGTIGIAPGSRVKTTETVTIDYCYSTRRLDALVRHPDGQESVIRGQPALTDPLPPEVPAGVEKVAHLWVPYFSDGRNPERFPVLDTAAEVRTATAAGRLPRALAKLRRGEPLKVVCWGDSVTEGGDASTPAHRYPAVFERLLKARYPRAAISVEAVAVGGSNSRQWLYPERYRTNNPRIDWQRVERAKPDVVTVEFVNDAGLTPDEVKTVYAEIAGRVQALGAELVLITPHFTMPVWMKFTSLRETVDQRPYVLALRQFAHGNNVALADAAARWEHLWKEGVPYVTLLKNGINHPEDRGHRLFAEELILCF